MHFYYYCMFMSSPWKHWNTGTGRVCTFGRVRIVFPMWNCMNSFIDLYFLTKPIFMLVLVKYGPRWKVPPLKNQIFVSYKSVSSTIFSTISIVNFDYNKSLYGQASQVYVKITSKCYITYFILVLALYVHSSP